MATGRVRDNDVKRFREMLYVVHVGGKPSHARWDDVRRLGSFQNLVG